MIDINKLIAHGAPGTLGRLNSIDIAKIESLIGTLPGDFTIISSVYGLGSFGDLVLFSPYHPKPMFSIPEGVILAREFLIRQDKAFEGLFESSGRILGYIGTRRYLHFRAGRWAIVDFEMSSVTSIGRDLVLFIDKTYKSLREGGENSDLAQTIWKGAIDGVKASFFTPAKKIRAQTKL